VEHGRVLGEFCFILVKTGLAAVEPKKSKSSNIMFAVKPGLDFLFIHFQNNVKNRPIINVSCEVVCKS
jgi:hypothetical protein